MTAYDTDQAVVTVSDGTLLVFRAWLPHSVSVNTNARSRISVSFNVMFTAYDTTMSLPLWGLGSVKQHAGEDNLSPPRGQD